MADPTAQEVQDCGQFPNQNGIAIALPVAINQVNEVLSGVSVTATTKHDIMMYLAAHYTDVAQRQGSVTANKIGEVREDYANIYQAGLFSTRFGQTVCALDVSGKFAKIAQASAKPMQKALFRHVEPAPFSDSDDPAIQ